jgi:hypothetical protein
MWTAFILNFHSNLFILYDGHCCNGKEAAAVGPFSAVLLFFIYGSSEGCDVVSILFECFPSILDFFTQTFFCHVLS